MKAELFDRYVREVGRRLPKKQRADVEAELHSLLLDTLKGRLGEQGVEVDAAPEEDQVAVLAEFGPPAAVADQYWEPHRYLIGPRLFGLYQIVVAAVAGAITLSHLILLALAMWGEPATFRALARAGGGVFESYFGAVLAGFGSVTLTFAILERVLPEAEWAVDEPKEWDPRTLPAIEDRSRVEAGGLIVEVALTVIALIVFNLYPQWVGAHFVVSLNDAPREWISVPLLAEVFFTDYLPFLNVLWVAEIGLKLVLLRQGRWQRITRLVDLLLAAFGAVLLYRMAFGPSILSLAAIEPASLRDALGSILPGLLKVGLIIGLLATIVEVVRKLYRVFRSA